MSWNQSQNDQYTSLSKMMILCGTNEGTYSANEAAKVCGTGDPAFADVYRWEQVGNPNHVELRRKDGSRYVGEFPGVMRHFSSEMTEARRKLRALTDLIGK